MIRKILLGAILLCTASLSLAQDFTCTNITASATSQKGMKKAPANALKWGYSLEENFTALGTSATGTFGVAIKVPGTGELKGGKVFSVNLPVYYTGMKDVTVWGCKNLASDVETRVFEKAVTGALEAGYMEITLDTPYEIDGDFFVGYTFTITDLNDTKAKYPIGKFEGTTPGSLYVKQNKDFVDYSGGEFGMSALQIFVTDVQQDEYDAHFDYKRAPFTVAGSENTLLVDLLSNGSKAIENIEYTVEINGTTTTKTADVSVPAGFRKSAKFNIHFNAPEAIEPYTMKVAITKVNGQENSNKSILYVYGDNVIRKATYKTLVEELTGTGCGNCPRGWVGMEAVKAQCSDIAVPIAVHQYNSTDPMYIDLKGYFGLPLEGAPSALINRDVEIDPYFGSSVADNYGIINDVKALSATIPPVAIHMFAYYNTDQTEVETKTEVEFLSNSGTYSIEYVLTADALKGSSSAWRQVNYYLDRDISTQNVDPDSELAEFFTGGIYGKNPVFLTFNDVAIASSFVNGVNTASEMPIDFVAGDKFEDTNTMSLPTKAALKSALKKDQIYANAIVLDENGYCVNAARVRVVTEEEAAGISNVNADSNADSNANYNVAGQRVGMDYKGLVIKNGKKYLK